MIHGLQALLNERDAEIDRLRGAGVERVPDGATHFVATRWFRIDGDCWKFLNAYGKWQKWTRSPISGLRAVLK